jgi:arginase family enzyme
MTYTPTFATKASFLGITRNDRAADFVVAGVPLDIGTTHRAGARDGPHAIRRASRVLTDGEHPELWVAPAALNVSDIGDFQLVLGDIPASLQHIERQAAGIYQLLALGGEHGVTLPLLRALSRRIGPLALVHFDAHVDTWPTNFGQTYAHGSVFYHAIRERLVEPKHMIQIGIRSPVQPTCGTGRSTKVSPFSRHRMCMHGVLASASMLGRSASTHLPGATP